MPFGNIINLTSANSLNEFSNAHRVAYDILVEEEELRKIFCEFIKDFVSEAGKSEAGKIEKLNQKELSNSVDLVLNKYKSSHAYPVIKSILERKYVIQHHVVEARVIEKVITGKDLLIKGYRNHSVEKNCFDIIKKEFFKKILNPWIRTYLMVHDITRSPKINGSAKPKPPKPHVQTVDELLKEVVNNISPKALKYKNADEFAKESIKQMKRAVMDDGFIKFLRQNRQAQTEFYAVVKEAEQYFKDYYKYAELTHQQANYEVRKEAVRVMNRSFVVFKEALKGSKNLLTYIRDDAVARETITALKNAAKICTSEAEGAVKAGSKSTLGGAEKAAVKGASQKVVCAASKVRATGVPLLDIGIFVFSAYKVANASEVEDLWDAYEKLPDDIKQQFEDPEDYTSFCGFLNDVFKINFLEKYSVKKYFLDYMFFYRHKKNSEPKVGYRKYTNYDYKYLMLVCINNYGKVDKGQLIEAYEWYKTLKYTLEEKSLPPFDKNFRGYYKSFIKFKMRAKLEIAKVSQQTRNKFKYDELIDHAETYLINKKIGSQSGSFEGYLNGLR